MTLVYLLVGLMPPFLQRWIRNLLGARIERGARISPFTLIAVRDLRMGRGARIDPLVVIKAETFIMGIGARIRPLCKFRVRQVELGRDALVDPCVLVNCDYGPRSQLQLGRAVRVFSFSVLEPSEGIFVGDHAGLGGQCLIFCHGSWPNYLDGAPYARGSVRIGEQVWIPWRVMILPNVEIGAGAVIGAHSLVRSNVPPRSLFSGVPARLITEVAWTEMHASAEKERRLAEIIESFHAFHEDKLRGRIDFVAIGLAGTGSKPSQETVIWSFAPLQRSDVDRALSLGPRITVIDLGQLWVLSGGPMGEQFVRHLSTFGVRLSPVELDEL